MHISILPVALSLLPLTLAQYDSPSSKTTSSSSAANPTVTGAIHKVTVGQNSSLVFSPDSITAAVGDWVEWHFFPPTHSVVQASFNAPCAPLANAFASGGFATTTTENANVFRVQVNSTAPIWYYCGFPGHCQNGMVGVINPPSNATVQDFADKAATASSVAAPKGPVGGIVGPAAVQASSPSSTSSSPSSSPTKSLGIESKGGIQWVTFGITGAVAAAFGVFML